MSEAYAAQPQDNEEQESGAPDLGEATEANEPAQHPLLSLVNVPNLGDHLDPSILATMGSKVCEEFAIDETSRDAEGWTERDAAAMKLALQVREDKNYPWPKASNVKFPLLSTAAIQFNARSYSALIDGSNVVKGKVLGADNGVPMVGPDGQPAMGPQGPQWKVQPGAKQDRADRVAAHMSYQLLFEMDGWEEDTDKLLMMLPIVGCAFRKSYFDPIRGYNCSHVVPPKEFVVNYWTRDLDSCPRATHVLKFYPHEIAEKMRSGLWLKAELGPATDAANDDQAPHEFLEQHRLWDLDGDGYPEPYIITVHKETQKTVRVVARFDADGIKLSQDGKTVLCITPTKIFTKYPFIPAPDGSFYDIGFGTLLLPLNGAIDSTINQLMDAGHLANVQGGFIGQGVSIKSGNQSFRPGEWKKVESAGGPLRDSIVPLPTNQPSTVLFQLLGMLIEASKDVTATQDILSGDTGQSQQPVGTTLAVIEQGLKTFTAIVKRLHRALKHEIGILYALNRRYLEPQQYFNFQDTPGVVAREDYDAKDIDIVPVSDPAMATDMQKLGRAQFLMQFLGKGLNEMAIIERVLEAASISDIKALMPQGPPKPDPKVIEMADKSRQKDRELDQRDIQLNIEHAEARAGIELTEANAQLAMTNAILAGPQFQLAVEQALDQRLAMMMQANGPSSDQGTQNGGQSQAAQPGPAGGMAVPPGHALVPVVPQGPGGPPQGPMGVGPGNGPPPPDQGAAPVGVGQPGMG